MTKCDREVRLVWGRGTGEKIQLQTGHRRSSSGLSGGEGGVSKIERLCLKMRWWEGVGVGWRVRFTARGLQWEGDVR